MDMTDLQADGAQDTEKLPPEPRTADDAPLREALVRYDPNRKPSDDADVSAEEWRAAYFVLADIAIRELQKARAALTATPAPDGFSQAYLDSEREAYEPAPEPFYDSDGIPIPDELFAGLEPASPERSDPAQLDPWDRHSDPARRFAYWFTSAPMQRQIEFVREWGRQHPDDLARLTARQSEATRAAATPPTYTVGERLDTPGNRADGTARAAGQATPSKATEPDDD